MGAVGYAMEQSLGRHRVGFKNRAPNGSNQKGAEGGYRRRGMGGGEEHTGSKVFALGPLFCEAGNEASHLLTAEMKGMDRKQSSNKSQTHQSILRAQLRLSTLNVSCLGAQKKGAKNRLMPKMENG